MKKFFTLIALMSACIPAIQGMEANLPTDVQKKYDKLTVLIQNADIKAFKPAFDALTLPAKNIAALRQIVLDAKTAVNKEIKVLSDKNKTWAKIAQDALAGVYGLSDPAAVLDAHTLPSESVNALQQVALNTKTDVTTKLEVMGDNNKDWSQIAKGALAGVYGVSNILTVFVFANSLLTATTSTDVPSTFLLSLCMPAMLPVGILDYVSAKLSGGYRFRERMKCSFIVVLPIIAYKTIPYGIKTFKAGLNYKQYLQDQLINLDAIAAHITHVQAQVA